MSSRVSLLMVTLRLLEPNLGRLDLAASVVTTFLFFPVELGDWVAADLMGSLMNPIFEGTSSRVPEDECCPDVDVPSLDGLGEEGDKDFDDDWCGFVEGRLRDADSLDEVFEVEIFGIFIEEEGYDDRPCDTDDFDAETDEDDTRTFDCLSDGRPRVADNVADEDETDGTLCDFPGWYDDDVRPLDKDGSAVQDENDALFVGFTDEDWNDLDEDDRSLDKDGSVVQDENDALFVGCTDEDWNDLDDDDRPLEKDGSADEDEWRP
ncbi:unnamed protein product [Owenia fusiformis]|uniref:Uncharacterized protein n=1 Tax=Owenia fusiformis TaxID=6347 RepID=A0A8S4PVM1_OWEFU|nr:unnamed protein product [Owenia fusiformis]